MTANISSKSRSNPYVFTEQGVYMFQGIVPQGLFVQDLEDYFIANPDKIDAAGNNDATVTVHLSADNSLVDNGDTLIEIAKSVYAGGSSRSLHKVV